MLKKFCFTRRDPRMRLYVQAVLRGLKPCVIGIVLATGIDMVLGNGFGTVSTIQVNVRAIVITAALAAALLGYQKVKHKKLSPILLIILAAFLGAGIYSV